MHWFDILKQQKIAIDEIELFLKENPQGYAGINEKNTDGKTPLILAIERINLEPKNISQSGLDIVDLLIDAGASIEEEALSFLFPKSKELLFRILQRGLLEASCNKSKDICKNMLDFSCKCDFDIKSLLNDICFNDGRFVLHCALQRQDIELIELFMNYGAHCSEKNANGVTALCVARETSPSIFIRMIDFLMLQYPLYALEWRANSNDYILEELLKVLSNTFMQKLPPAILIRYTEENYAAFYVHVMQFEKTKMVAIILNIGKKVGEISRKILREELINEQVGDRSLLAKLFWTQSSRFAFFINSNAWWLKEINEGLLKEYTQDSGNRDFGSRQLSKGKRHKDVDFSEFVMVKGNH